MKNILNVVSDCTISISHLELPVTKRKVKKGDIPVQKYTIL
ncbi:hypothetical protein P9246_01900 [Aeribacillus pallidus]|nr:MULTISPECIES: hypothetical protein [Aeribacillus]MED0650342.1 hypothetical protein [Aeribacillus composti]MED4485521.1 hypothetical protein [Aeribacillus pallidus]